MEAFRKANLIGCLNDSEVNSMNYKKILWDRERTEK